MTPSDWRHGKVDRWGRMHSQPRTVGKDLAEMLSPVQCSYCNAVYDLCGVETYDPKTGRAYGRYADCTMYRTPCCKRIVDDRPAGWVSFPAFTKLDRQGRPLAR